MQMSTKGKLKSVSISLTYLLNLPQMNKQVLFENTHVLRHRTHDRDLNCHLYKRRILILTLIITVKI